MVFGGFGGDGGRAVSIVPEYFSSAGTKTGISCELHILVRPLLDNNAG
jgi:hypothetical protein